MTERYCLAESHRQPFAGDCIHGAGGLTNQSNPAAANGLQPPRAGDRSSDTGRALRVFQMTSQRRKLGNARCKGSELSPGNQGYADFFFTNGSNISLALGAPVDFNKLTQRPDLEMLPDANALRAFPPRRKAGPVAHA